MSIFRFVRASSLLYIAGRYRQRLYLALVLLLVAATTAWLYGDIAVYLQRHHPQLEVYALLGKTIIVYGSLLMCLWLFRPRSGTDPVAETVLETDSADRLQQLAARDRLVSRYDAILSRGSPALKSDKASAISSREELDADDAT